MAAAHWSGMYGTVAAAGLLGRKPATIRSWRNRGWLAAQGLDERGNPLHTADALRTCERLVRQHAFETSGVDPRQHRDRGATQPGAGIAA